jgi:hypothetical protein
VFSLGQLNYYFPNTDKLIKECYYCKSMKRNLLVISAIMAITVMAFLIPAATAPANAICAKAGSTVACAGDGAFAKAGSAVAIAFSNFAKAFIR